MIHDNRISAEEAFKRGFWGGFGLWCSFMVLNIALVLLGWMALVALGIVGSASVPADKRQQDSRPPARTSVDIPSRSTRSGRP